MSQHLWHPFADMSRVPGREVVLVRGDGCWVWDAEGSGYLDATAGLWYCNVGHGRAEIAEAGAAQMRTLAGYQTFDVMANRPALDLAERVCALSPLDGPAAAFFTSGGSDSIDTAAKIVRRFWRLHGRPERTTIVARGGAYHGTNAFGTSLAGIEGNAAGWGPLIREVVHVEPHDAGALAEVLERDGEHIGAFIGEPVLGAAGVHPPREGYWADVRALCDEHDVLLIADEVVTGFGRLGSWFGCERLGLRPDLITVAKGITSGYLPLGAVIAGARVREALWAPEAGAFRHGYTYSGHPAACAVALANLDVIEREGLLERVERLEPVLARAVGALESHPLVGEVRHVGLLAAVELAADALAADPALVDRTVAAARNEGLLVRGLVGRSLQISPPFVIEENEIEYLADRLRRALDAQLGTVGGPVAAACGRDRP